MVTVRKDLVFSGLLIAMIALAAPVAAVHVHTAPGTFDLTEAMAPSTAPSSGLHPLDASARAMFDAMAVNDTSALAPPSAVFESIHPGDSLQDAIDAAAPGSTLCLDPGIYYEHDLVVDKALYIMANGSLGGTRANTIIDARGEGRIFNVTHSEMFVIDNLTLRNGYVDGNGGAMMSVASMTGIISSTITNCSATGSGGAVWADSVITVLGWSAVTRCSAAGITDDGSGGAIYSDDGLVGAVYSSFSDCSAPGSYGGAIESGGNVIVLYSAFTRCSAIDGGALDFYDDGATVIGSTFTDCMASGNGGAIWADGGEVEILGSSFTRCTAGFVGGALAYGDGVYADTATFTGCSAGYYGGAIATTGDIITTGVAFRGCSAGYDGGAVITIPSTARYINSTFTGCSASRYGGAIAAFDSDFTILTSSITGCSAAEGGAIYNDAITGTSDIHFSRVYGNTATGSGPAINTTAAVDAAHTWWGTTSDPGALMNGPVTYDPWLVLGITADPMALTLPQTSEIRTNLTYDSDGVNTAGGGIFVPNGIPNAYAVASGPGIVAPATAGSINGAAQGTYVTTVAGTPTIAGTVDGQTVYITLSVAQGTWTPVPTTIPNDDDWPQVGGGSGQISSGSAGTTGTSGLPLMTVIVNIGGDSKAHQAVVTGTKLSDLIVTGAGQHTAGDNVTAPAGIVFQYISLVPARYDTITNAAINFTVPQAWLDDNSIAPGSIVLYRLTANGWETLPTTFLYAKDGTAYFSAQSAGFSVFAIAGTPAVPADAVTATQAIVSTPEPEREAIPPVPIRSPDTTQTTPPPATAGTVPAKSSPFPLVPVIAVICCTVLIGGGWYARRWWIRRQNPALFAEYD
jgi:hypothetical protein